MNPFNMFGNNGFLFNAMQQMAVPQPPPVPPYKGTYRVFPVVMANKSSLESGDKIILPPSALDHLARLRVQYPMVFSVTARSSQRKTHCGVMEFSSDEGVCYMPYWMMQNLLIETGAIVDLYNVSLPKGNFVQFQPHSMEFTYLNNPRVVLERALRNFTCLTNGDTIAIQHGEQTFFMDVLEVKPGEAISVIETDVNVDFAPPKDMPPEELAKPASLERAHSLGGSVHGGSDAHHGAVQTSDYSTANIIKSPNSKAAAAASAEPQKEASYFEKLGGGHSLKSRKPTTPTSSSSTAAAAPAAATPAPTSAPAAKRQVQEVQGRFTYIYEVDERGNKRLMRRIPTPPSKLNGSAAAATTNGQASVPLSQRAGGNRLS